VKYHPELSDKDDLRSNLQREDLIENQLKKMINPAIIIRSSMSIIDVTQEDGTITAETTNECIGNHLLMRNPKVYRATGLTPFGDMKLGKCLGPNGSSPLATPILIKLLPFPLPQPRPRPRARTYAHTFQRTQRATQLRGVLARAYCVTVQNMNTVSNTTVP
jgi:hypothetical protein